LNAAEDVVCF